MENDQREDEWYDISVIFVTKNKTKVIRVEEGVSSEGFSIRESDSLWRVEEDDKKRTD